jgi:predicted nucleic acid-binding protein
LVLDQGVNMVDLDDPRGRRFAKEAGLTVVGVLGLLDQAKTLDLIPASRPYAEQLLAVGAYYSPELVRRVIADSFYDPRFDPLKNARVLAILDSALGNS